MEALRLADKPRSRECVNCELTILKHFGEAARLALISASSDGAIRYVNRAAAALLGYEPDELRGQPIDVIVPDCMKGAHQQGMARAVHTGQTRLSGKTVEVCAKHKNGSEVPIEISVSMWRDGDGVAFGAIIKDISERRARDQRLLRLATRDSLTGLFNRPHLESELAALMERGSKATVILLDLDGFRDVNDNFGHAVGDALLQAIAVRLPTAIDSRAILARFGGDEFAVLLPDVDDRAEALAAANEIAACFVTAFELGAHSLHMAVNFGCAMAPAHGADPEEVLASADLALDHAKRSGSDWIRFYDPVLRVASIERRALQDELLRALKCNEFELYYQPQVRILDGKMFGVEALLRWRHPARGLLGPADFMSVLEGCSLAGPVGSFVIHNSLDQMRAWREAGLAAPRMAINLFSAQLRSGWLVSEIEEALAAAGIEPADLEVEITENIALQSDDGTLATISALRDLGVGIAFDDFGTGYASLQSLKRFPLTTLKIDRSFVADITSDPQDTAILGAMVGLGAGLHLETIAEGIETREQEHLLKAMGCRFGQGFLYGKPMPASDIADLLADKPDVRRA